MKQLPDPAIYEEELRNTPWGEMIREVILRSDRRAPFCGDLVDLMCGPGYLLHTLHEQRPDLNLKGVDNDPRFVDFAKARTDGVEFVSKDVLKWRATHKYDVVTCTGSLHHLAYDQQEPFIRKIADILKPDGVAIIGDPYISDYQNELERRLGAAELGDAFTTNAIRMFASDEMI